MPENNSRPSRPSLPSLNLILTHRCNLHCRYCLRRAGYSRSELPFSLIQKNLPLLHARGVREICLTGGEATLYSKFDELLKLLSRYDFKIFLESNGININQGFIQKLTAAVPARRLEILISLDHWDPERHDQFRGRGTQVQALRAIQLLRHHQIKVVTNTVIHKANQLKAVDIFKLVGQLEQLGVFAASFSPLVQVGKGRRQMALSRPEYEHLRKTLSKARKHFKDRIEIRFSLYHPEPIVARTTVGSSYQTCKKIKNITLSYKGYHPCLYLDHLVIADLKTSLDDIFGQDLEALRKSVFLEADVCKAPCFHCIEYFNQYFKKFPYQLN